MKISNEVLNILEVSETREGKFYLPQITLERDQYVAVNKVLEMLGGKWSRKDKAHIFEADPADAIDQAMLTGEVTDTKKEFQFFPTPKSLAKKLVEMAELKEGVNILEPSAGDGNIADMIKDMMPENCDLSVCEINPKCRKTLTDKAYGLMYILLDEPDFLKLKDKEVYDRIIANPPFSKQQDVDHILKMFKLLKPGGILVSVTSPSWQFRENKKSVAFREFLEENNAEIDNLPEGTFKESGTMIRTCIIKVSK